jgi:class 3 adenylate cyclase
VVVVRRRARDVRVLAARQVEPFNHTEVGQQVQGTKQRGPADAQAPRPSHLLELRGGEMTIVLGDECRHRPPWAGEPIPRRIEGVDDRVRFDHGRMLPSLTALVENESHLYARWRVRRMGAVPACLSGSWSCLVGEWQNRQDMPNLPSGTVTFLFSDIEGSTSLLKELGDEQYAELLRMHRSLVRETFGLYHGQEIDTQGDAFFYSFHRAREAVAAAVAVQRAHRDQAWPQGVSVRMRLGLHTGEPTIGDEGYTGLDVVRASRIAAVGRGGQVLLSDTTRAIVAGGLPDGVTIHALGDQRLKDIDQPEPLHELRISDVPVSEPMAVATKSDSIIPADALASMPAWIRGAAEHVSPFAGRASQLIEDRVLAEIDASLKEDPDLKAKALPPTSGPPGQAGSMADEIAKLRALRDEGTLSEEQYAKALDRTITSGN